MRQKLEETEADHFETFLKDICFVVKNSVSEAMGALYGTPFMKLSQNCDGKKRLALNGLTEVFG